MSHSQHANLLEAEAYRAFWRLIVHDGMGGVSLPYPATVAWFEEQGLPKRHREPFRVVWDALLARYLKSRSAKKEDGNKGKEEERRSSEAA